MSLESVPGTTEHKDGDTLDGLIDHRRTHSVSHLLRTAHRRRSVGGNAEKHGVSTQNAHVSAQFSVYSKHRSWCSVFHKMSEASP